MKFLQSKHFSLQFIVIIKHGKSCVNGIDKIIINFGCYFITESGRSNRILISSNLCHRPSFTNHCIECCCKRVTKLSVCFINLSERCLTHSAVATHKECNIVCISKFNEFALFISDFSKTKVAVSENTSNITMCAKSVLKLRHKLLAFVREHMGLCSHCCFNHSAEGFKRRIFNEPSVYRFILKRKQTGAYKPRSRTCLNCKCTNLSVKCLESIV